MELKEFVTAVLTEIIDGVKDAQQEAGYARDGEVNPLLRASPGALEGRGYLVTARSGQLVQSVKFDVAVTAQKGTGTKGGIGIFSVYSWVPSDSDHKVNPRHPRRQ